MGAQSRRIGNAIQRGIETAAKALALEIDKELRKRPPVGTPVDTGHARRNWVPSVGVRSTAEAGDESAHDAGVSAVLAYKLADGAIWISNVVPYIRRLNYGHSKQTPPGFVERAVDISIQRIQQKFASASAWRSEFTDAVGAAGANNLASAYSPFGGNE